MGSKEYLMLREEILHLDDVIVHTINFFYVFLATFIVFSLTQDDTIYILFSYVIILPAYLLVIRKMNAMNKIGGYLQVFHESRKDSELQWETNNKYFAEITSKRGPRLTIKTMSFMYTFHYPFAVTNLAIVSLFMLRSKWCNLTFYEISKIIICVALCTFIFLLIIENRKVGTEYYIDQWTALKNESKDR